MSFTGLDTFDRTMQLTNEWLKDLMEELHTEDRHLAYSSLRVVLHALRDRITVDEAAHLGAQMPMLVRGFYYEGFHPASMPSADDADAIIAKVRAAVEDRDPRMIIQAVLNLLQRRIAMGEIEEVYSSLPKDLRSLWRPAA